MSSHVNLTLFDELEPSRDELQAELAALKTAGVHDKRIPALRRAIRALDPAVTTLEPVASIVDAWADYEPRDDTRLAIDILQVDGRKVWPYFAPHHYLTRKATPHRAFLAVMPDGSPVGFTSIMAFPHGSLKNAWREHRTVVLPDFQGLGLGARLSDWTGEYVKQVIGGRFYSKTSHPRLGAYRNESPYWRATNTSGKLPSAGMVAAQAASFGWVASTTRTCWSHEYMGREVTQ